MNKDIKYILVLILLAYFFFFFGNGLISLTSPDEVFYAQTAKEMIKHNSWMTPILFDEPQFEKPILLYWLLRIAFIIFGVSSFSARLFPAFFATIGIAATYYFSKLLFKDDKRAFFSALILLSSGLYIGLARTVFTDMIFSVLILLSLLSFYWGFSSKNSKRAGIILFFVFGALASLTKGPLGLIIPFSTVFVFLIFSGNIKFLLSKDTLLGLMIFLAIALPWYILMIHKYNQSFIQEFFYNDHYRRLVEAEHAGSDTWYFYPLTMLGAMFPWSIFVLLGLFYAFFHLRKIDKGNIFLVCWVAVALLIFQFAHSKLASYIFPMFPALAMICGNFIYDSVMESKRQQKFFVVSMINWFIALFILIGVVFAAFKFSYYLSSLRPVYFIASIFGLWLIITALYIRKKKAFVVFNMFVILLPIFLSIIPFIHNDIEPYLSSRYACEYLLNNNVIKQDTYLLCSKNFVRGVRFYTDMKVAVYNNSNFFSPHPIIFLKFDDQLKEFLDKQGVTYGFIRKSSLDNLRRVSSKGFDMQILKNIGSQYIIKIQKTQTAPRT